VVVMSSPRFATQRSAVPRPVLATRTVGAVSERVLAHAWSIHHTPRLGYRDGDVGRRATIAVRTTTPLL
jgi:hypothetical protein